mmetsp:Transcript_48359/g.113189  ORF Transcript_48359/g.113189 Transcript_48359/m.113189 type:complete len:269 (-) Transcript_48359:190-996(-)
MWPFCSTASSSARERARTSGETDNDEALARSLQEQQDAEVAQMLARQGSFGLPAQQRVVTMQCGVCQSSVQVQVPLSAAPDSVIRVPCPRCTAENEFRIPGSSMRAGPPPGMVGPSMFDPSMMGDALDDELIHVGCEMGNTMVEMMIDTGAQTSVISEPLVRRLQLQGHMDSRFQGMAAGVGTARILGKLRGVPVKMGHVEFALDFSVLGVEQPLLMLGIDQMRRFKCVVNLERQCLTFGGSDGVEVPFLPPDSRRRVSYRQAGCPTM